MSSHRSDIRRTEPSRGSELIQHLRQRGTRIQGTGGGIDEHPVTAGGGQRVTLQRIVLVAGGGHPRIPQKVTHARNVAELVRAGRCESLIPLRGFATGFASPDTAEQPASAL